MKKTNILFLLILLPALFSCTSKTEQAKQFFNEGIAKTYKGDFESALKDFDKAIEIKADFFEAYYQRGNVKFNLRQYKEAIMDFDKAIEINPEYADAYVNRGNTVSIIEQNPLAGCEDWKKAKDLGKHNLDEKIKFCK